MPSDAAILIVDDHEDTLYALESALAPLGYRLLRATSGDEALKHVLRGQIGLLLLDVRMPGVSGLDVVRYLRRLEQTQHIPVILLTGFGTDQELTSTAFDLGVADLVMKPVDPWSLRTKVRYLYDAHQRALALEREVRALRTHDHSQSQQQEQSQGPRATAPAPQSPRPPRPRADTAIPVQRDGENRTPAPKPAPDRT
ncbi:response regulator [Streptomyces griseoviridis]|uniref:Response regulator n=1 Tax=Streptomyces griseoviridis TaxID=45398 RepID=A0ABX5TUM5_STRGD|nr:response regulator [Streptomyces griseoviridis]QCN85285.1 response regulator [Streptomyces griseoviridis]